MIPSQVKQRAPTSEVKGSLPVRDRREGEPRLCIVLTKSYNHLDYMITYYTNHKDLFLDFHKYLIIRIIYIDQIQHLVQAYPNIEYKN